MIKRFILMILALSFTSLVSATNLKPVENTVPAPPLQLNDMRGKAHDLGDYKGSVVLVQFWGTYCPPCRKEMPSMNRLMEKMSDTPFTILAINMGEPKDAVEQFVKEVNPEFTILLDPQGASIGDWKVFAAPANFIVGPDGAIHYTLFGGVEWDSDELVSSLKDLAAGTTK